MTFKLIIIINFVFLYKNVFSIHINKKNWIDITNNKIKIDKLIKINNYQENKNIICTSMGFPGKNYFNLLSPKYWGHEFIIAQNQTNIFTAGNTGKCSNLNNDNLMFNSKNIPHKLDIFVKDCFYINNNKWKFLINKMHETYSKEYCKKYKLFNFNCVNWVNMIYKYLNLDKKYISFVPIINYKSHHFSL